MRIRLFIIRLLSGIKHSLGVLSFFFLAPTTDLTEEGKQTEAVGGCQKSIFIIFHPSVFFPSLKVVQEIYPNKVEKTCVNMMTHAHLC